MNPERIFRKLLLGEVQSDNSDPKIRVTRNSDSFDIYVADNLAMKMWRYGWIKFGDDSSASQAEHFLRKIGKA